MKRLKFTQRVRCALYKLYDRAKSTWIISQLFYHGQKYQHYFDISVTGQIEKVNGYFSDGDYTFELATIEGQKYHCEITPCYPIPTAIRASLHRGGVVKVFGTQTFDPAHLGDPDKWEIHPVKSIEVWS